VIAPASPGRNSPFAAPNGSVVHDEHVRPTIRLASGTDAETRGTRARRIEAMVGVFERAERFYE
jgi:hypothetical protein